MGPITPLGLTRAGAFYYRTPSSLMDVYTVSLDPQTGNVTGPPKKEPLSWEGNNRWPDWSPDGKRLAYVSTRPTVVGPFQPGRAREFIVCVYSADTGSVREYRHEKVFLGPHWSPDGRYLYVAASNMDGRGIYRLDVESGEFTPFLGAGENQAVRYFQVSADGKWIVYGRGNSRILRRDARTGEEKELDSSSFPLVNLVLSRDGSHLAYALQIDEKTKVLKVMQFPDGTPKEIQRLRETGGGPSEIALSPDGRFIYYSDVLPEGGGAWRLWRIPADGGNAQDVGLGVRNFEQLSVHPDGARITFSADTINPERSQVWVMENFLPRK
jgi:Tol biopolymer transport system component